MTRDRESVLGLLEKRREQIRRFGVRRLALFGSCVRGEQTNASDLDFVVEFEKKTFDGYMDLKAFLEELFDCPVDLVLADTIKPRLREAITSEMIHVPGL
jgi:predicted nucleotidyltransferase